VSPASRPIRPWLPLGFSFLSGLPEPARRRRVIMVVQAFVDDSGGKGSTRHFVLAGLVGSAEVWAEFSDEWAACLKQSPSIPVFKMKDAMGRPSGHFFGMTESERDAKLLALARIINRYPKIATFSIIDLDAHAQTWALGPKPQSEPYFWPYQNTIMAVCHALWDAGWRERFEIIYDEDVIFGPRARPWYPAIKKMFEMTYPEQGAILPVDPMFKTDDEFLPLQAADMFAGCLRYMVDSQDFETHAWLLNAMPNVQATGYSQFYDLQRMKDVMAEAQRLFAEGKPPLELLQLIAQMRADMKRR
jgi:hypothetical protein